MAWRSAAGVTLGHDQASVADHLGDGARDGADDRHARGHRFDQDATELLAVQGQDRHRRQHQHVERLQQGGHLRRSSRAAARARARVAVGHQ